MTSSTMPCFPPVEGLNENEARVFWALPSDLNHDKEKQLLSRLSDDERQAYEALRIPADRRAYLAAHILMRKSLSNCSTYPESHWTFTRGKNGRPILAGQSSLHGLSFNISHSRTLVACIVSRREACGVDVEPLRPIIGYQDIAARFFAPIERDQILNADETHREALFLSLWTLKEATLKSTGDALLSPLDSVAFRLNPENRVELLQGSSLDLKPDEWAFFLERPLRGHCLAAAVRKPGKDPFRFVPRPALL